MRRFLKIAGYFFLSCIVILLAVALFTQSGLFKDWLRRQIVAQAKSRVNGELAIGRIGGNLISNFSLSDLLFTSAGDTLFYLPALEASFRPAGVLQRSIVIKILSLERPYLKLRQAADSTWNAARLLAAPPDRSPAGEAPPFDWTVNLEDLRVSDARIRLQPLAPAPFLPALIHGFDARLGLSYAAEQLEVSLRQMKLRTLAPEFVINEMRFLMALDRHRLRWREFQLRTSQSLLRGSGEIATAGAAEGAFTLAATPADLSELHTFFPEVNLIAKPVFTLTGSFRGDSLAYVLDLTERKQQIHATGRITNMAVAPALHVDARLHSVDAAAWLPDTSLACALNGTLTVDAVGRTADALRATVIGAFANSAVGRRSVRSLKFNLRYAGQQVNGKAEIADRYGTIDLQGRAGNLFSTPKFALRGRVRRLDLQQLNLPGLAPTNLNFDFQAEGFGVALDSLQSSVKVLASPSEFAGVQIDTTFFVATLQGKTSTIDSLYLESQVGKLFLAGRLSLVSENDLQFHGELGDLRWIKRQMDADTLFAQGTFAGRIYGEADSLLADMSYKLDRFAYNTIEIAAVRGDFAMTYKADSLQGQALMECSRLDVARFTVDTASVQANFTQKGATFLVDFARLPLFSGMVRASFQNDSLPNLSLAEAQLRIQDRLWLGGGENSRVRMAPDGSYELENIYLASGSQFVRANGVIRLAGHEDLRIEIGNSDLSEISALFGQPLRMQGKLDVIVSIRGTAEDPEIMGNLLVQNGRLTNFPFESMGCDFAYQNQRLDWKFRLQRQDKTSLQGEGFVPADLSLNAAGERLFRDRPVRFQVDTQNLDLGLFETFMPEVKNLRGKLVCDVKIENTLANPLPVGIIRVVNGALEVPYYGASYQDIQVALTIDTSEVSLTQFRLAGGRGTLDVSGQIKYGSEGIKSGLQEAELEVRAENFLVARNQDYEAVISGTGRVWGNLSNPRFRGEVTVLRSSLYLPAFEDSRYIEDITTRPLLMAARRDTLAGTTAGPQTADAELDYLDRLNGTLTIDFPRNTWLRGPEINVEIAGTLEMVKTGPNYELFRTIRVQRGTYDLYGSRFDIENGLFTFEGGVEFNPNVEIVARHVFRSSDKSKHTLRLRITGKLYNPKLKFQLDDNEIEEASAISYLLFGRSIEELTQGERSQLASQSGFPGQGAAKSLLAGLVASQLTRTLGKELSLDVIEFQGDNDWRQATIVLGKYLTNQLYLSYQRDIKIGQTDELVPDQVILEYEIKPFLFLQATKGDRKSTGFDFIWKYEK